MKDTKLKATTVTYVLAGVCIVLVISIIGGGLFAASILQSKATDATHAVIDADISNNDVSRVLELDSYLKKNASIVDQTSQIAGSIGQYQQNTIVATVSDYARRAGVSITGYNFGTAATGSGVAATGASAGGISVSIGSPVAYRNFITFLDLLENGVMPVTVTSAIVSPDTQGGQNVVVNDIKIKVAN